jgi:hypothetical protein
MTVAQPSAAIQGDDLVARRPSARRVDIVLASKE